MKQRFLITKPSATLEPFVDCFWYAEGDFNTVKELVLPNGVIELIVNTVSDRHLAWNPRHTTDLRRFDRAWIAGLQEGPLAIQSEGTTRLFGTRFRPGGARTLIGPAVSELSNAVEDIEYVLGTQMNELIDGLCVSADSDPSTGFSIMDRFLQTRLGAADPDASIAYAVKLIRHFKTTAIATLAEHIGISHTHLVRKFRDSTGTTPKHMQTIFRFQSGLKLLLNPALDGAGIAATLGYHDQAHFIHEFKRLSGLTPGDYLRFKLADPNHALLVD